MQITVHIIKTYLSTKYKVEKLNSIHPTRNSEIQPHESNQLN